MTFKSVTVIAIAFAACTAALPAQDIGKTDNDIEGSSDCYRKDSTSCLKYKFFSFVDKMLDQRETFALADGVTVVRAANAPETGAPRSMDPASRIRNYFDTHSVRVELKGGDIVEAITNVGRALEDTYDSVAEDENDLSEESRGKKKKAAKILGPLMAALALKAAALIPVALAAIALIAGKALLIGKLALVLSAIIGLKKLLSQQKHVTYEVVAHPHHSSSASHSTSHDFGASSGYASTSDVGAGGGGYGGGGGGHSSGGWGRSMTAEEAAQAMAYSGQKPQ